MATVLKKILVVLEPGHPESLLDIFFGNIQMKLMNFFENPNLQKRRITLKVIFCRFKKNHEYLFGTAQKYSNTLLYTILVINKYRSIRVFIICLSNRFYSFYFYFCSFCVCYVP